MPKQNGQFQKDDILPTILSEEVVWKRLQVHEVDRLPIVISLVDFLEPPALPVAVVLILSVVSPLS